MELSNIELHSLQYLAAVISLGSLSKAADAMHTTRQAIARSISALENQLGNKLFERSYSGMIPSEFCKQLSPYVAAVLDSAKKLEEFSKEYNSAHNTVRFGVLGLYDTGRFISSLLREYEENNPEITIELSYFPWPDIHNAVLSGELDYAYSSIIPGYMPEKTKWIPITEESFVVLAGKGDVLAGAETISPQQLEGRDIILFTRYGIQLMYIEQYQKEQSVNYRPCITTSELKMLIDAVETGNPIGLVDKSVAATALTVSDSIVVKQILPAPVRCSGFIYRNSLSISPSHKKLLNFLKNRIAAYKNS